MRIFNEAKTNELAYEDLDFSKGVLLEDVIDIPEVIGVEEKWHYEVVKEYPNGGKEIEKVIDVKGVPSVPAHQEKIKIFKEYTEEELEQIYIDELRNRREQECFSVINRGKLWYDKLTDAQISELNAWYQDWLDVTETKIIPTKPDWLV